MIIKSLLSQDLYKLTMLQVFYREFPEATAKYRFKCRNKDVDLLPFKKEIEEEIDALCELRFTDEELAYLETLRFIFPDFIDYLEDFNLKRRYINVGEKDGKLDIVMNGPITRVSPFEIFVLKIVHEVYTRNVNPPNETILGEGRRRLVDKIVDFKKFVDENGYKPSVIDFGGRRSYTTEWHEFVVRNLNTAGVIIGTSDVDLARRVGIKAIGTQAHEYIQMFQAFYHPMDSQRIAFESWLDFYGNDLGTLLSDTLGDKKFLIDFTPDIAHRASSVRHDSGDPLVWGEMILAHYNAFGIDPIQKTLVFSDGLDFHKMFEIERRFHGRVKTAYGIGTHLTNDFSCDALQNVVKLVEVDGKPVAKISNNISKSMCEDNEYFTYLKDCLKKL